MKKIGVITLSAAILILTTSCATKSYSSAYSGGYNDRYVENEVDKLVHSENKLSTNNSRQEQKIIFSANLRLAVDEPSLTQEKLKEIAAKNEGYISLIGTYSSKIRVKSEKLDTAIAELETLGKVKSKNLIGKDVSEQYRDYQIRLENAENARARYLELLSKAENVEAALKVEVELERLNETIELLKGKIRSMNHLSEYSTITVYIEERKKPGILGYIGLGLYHSVKWLFVRN